MQITIKLYKYLRIKGAVYEKMCVCGGNITERKI